MFVPFRFGPKARNPGGVSVEAGAPSEDTSVLRKAEPRMPRPEARRVVPRKSLRQSMLAFTTFDPSV